MFLFTRVLVGSKGWSAHVQLPSWNKGHAVAIRCHYQLMSIQWPMVEQSMASSHSLLDTGTTVTARTAAVALMNAPGAAVCRCQGWKGNLNQSVTKAFVMHLVLWYLGIWVPLSEGPLCPVSRGGAKGKAQIPELI